MKLERRLPFAGGVVVRWGDRALIVLVVGLVAIYVSAKLHFFLHFGNMPVEDYLAEHGPLWAAAPVLALLAHILERIRETRPARAVRPRR